MATTSSDRSALPARSRSRLRPVFLEAGSSGTGRGASGRYRAGMAKTKNEARVAWHEAEADYRALIEPYAGATNTATLDRAAVQAIAKARARAERCLDAYVRRCLG